VDQEDGRKDGQCAGNGSVKGLEGKRERERKRGLNPSN
jgi:hypothetical protein